MPAATVSLAELALPKVVDSPAVTGIYKSRPVSQQSTMKTAQARAMQSRPLIFPEYPLTESVPVFPPTINCSVNDLSSEILGALPSSFHSTVIELEAPAETGFEEPAAGEVMSGMAKAQEARAAVRRAERTMLVSERGLEGARSLVGAGGDFRRQVGGCGGREVFFEGLRALVCVAEGVWASKAGQVAYGVWCLRGRVAWPRRCDLGTAQSHLGMKTRFYFKLRLG